MLLIYSCSEDVEVPLSSTTDAPDKSTSLERDPFESNYKPLESERTLIKSVNLYDGLCNEYSNFDEKSALVLIKKDFVEEKVNNITEENDSLKNEEVIEKSNLDIN